MPLNPASFQTATPLENFSVKVVNDIEKDYVALKLFPELMVGKSTGIFFQYNGAHLRLEKTDAPSGTEAPSGSYGVFTNTYTTKEKAFKGLVLERDAANFDRPVADLDLDTAAMNMSILMGQLEDAVHTKSTTSSNYPSALVTTLSTGDTWLDAASDPLEDIRALSEAVKIRSGVRPNTLTLAKKGLLILALHPAIRELTKYTMAGPVPTQLIAALMGLDNIFTSDAVKNTAIEGAADSLSGIWDDDAVLAYVAPNPGLRTMTYGRTIMRNKLYSKTIDAPELGRGMGAHWIENGWEFTPEFMAQASDSDGDAIAGGLIINIF